MASSALVKDTRSKIRKQLHDVKQPWLQTAFKRFETITKLDREFLVYGVASIFSLYLMVGYFAALACNIVGIAYPAYASIMAIQSAGPDDDKQWLTYWVVYGILTLFDFGAEKMMGWIPFYWVVKCAIFLYLYLPFSRGAEKIYTNYVDPFFRKHGHSITTIVQEAKTATVDEALKAYSKAKTAAEQAENHHEKYTAHDLLD